MKVSNILGAKICGKRGDIDFYDVRTPHDKRWLAEETDDFELDDDMNEVEYINLNEKDEDPFSKHSFTYSMKNQTEEVKEIKLTSGDVDIRNITFEEQGEERNKNETNT